MKHISILLLLGLAFAACSVVSEKPPADVIDNAVKRCGGVAHYLNNEYTLPVTGYRETNYYTRKKDEETWHIYDFEVSRELPTGSIGAFMPKKIQITVGFVKRGHSWYFRQM